MASAVRTGVSLSSESAGVLAAGQEILVTKKEHVGDRPRLQFVRVGGNSTQVCGWVSEVTGDGTRCVMAYLCVMEHLCVMAYL